MRDEEEGREMTSLEKKFVLGDCSRFLLLDEYTARADQMEQMYLMQQQYKMRREMLH
jgi:hypothetical protein